MARKKLGEILLAAGVIDAARLRTALMEQQRWGGYLGRILVEMKLVSEEVLVQALSQQLNFPAVNLDQREIPHEVLELVPGEVAEQHSMIPFALQGKFLDVALTDPTNMGIIDELRIRTQLNVRPYLAGPKMIERALANFYGRGQVAVSLAMRSRVLEGPGASAAGDPRVADAVDVLELDPAVGAGAPMPIEMSAAQRRAQAFALNDSVEASGAAVANLQERLAKLEALIQRDEDVIRKLLSLLVEKGVASREEVLERIK